MNLILSKPLHKWSLMSFHWKVTRSRILYLAWLCTIALIWRSLWCLVDLLRRIMADHWNTHWDHFSYTRETRTDCTCAVQIQKQWHNNDIIVHTLQSCVCQHREKISIHMNMVYFNHAFTTIRSIPTGWHTWDSNSHKYLLTMKSKSSNF